MLYTRDTVGGEVDANRASETKASLPILQRKAGILRKRLFPVLLDRRANRRNAMRGVRPVLQRDTGERGNDCENLHEHAFRSPYLTRG